MDFKDHFIKIIVHRTDTITAMVASCSATPIPVDSLGLAKLTSGLTRVEERLQRVIDDVYARSNLSDGNPILIPKYSIPNHMFWIVIMWHFGRDSLT